MKPHDTPKKLINNVRFVTLNLIAFDILSAQQVGRSECGFRTALRASALLPRVHRQPWRQSGRSKLHSNDTANLSSSSNAIFVNLGFDAPFAREIDQEALTVRLPSAGFSIAVGPADALQ